MDGAVVIRKLYRAYREAALASYEQIEPRVTPDELLITEELNSEFLISCEEHFGAEDFDQVLANKALLNLRKSGTLGPTGSRSVRLNHDQTAPIAEVAIRLIQDQYGCTLDDLLCTPKLRAEYDCAAQSICPSHDSYVYRKSALYLRKKRKLRPENFALVSGLRKDVSTIDADQCTSQCRQIPLRPGVYLFFDDSGYLYIGEAKNLRNRLKKHLDHSDNKALARYLWSNGTGALRIELHVFADDSRGCEAKVRKAYEAELIRSRQPRFNMKHI